MTFENTIKQALKLRDTQGDLKGAQRLVDRLFFEYDRLTPARKVVLHKEAANLLRYKGELDQSLAEYHKGLALAQKLGDIESGVDILRLIGFTTLKRFSTSKARKRADEALDRLRHLTGKSHDVAAANVWALIGNIESTDRNTKEAVEAYRKGLRHARKAKFYARVATLLGDLANKYIDLGRYHEAEESLKEDLKLSQKYHRHSYPNALVRLSYLYYLKNNPHRDLTKAWKYAQEALRVSKREGWGREVADAYQRLGKIAWYRKRNAESRRYLRLAIDQYKKVKHSAYAKWVTKVMQDLERGENSHHDYPQE